MKKYRNNEDGQIYTIEEVPFSTKVGESWENTGTVRVLKSTTTDKIYFSCLLASADGLWEEAE